VERLLITGIAGGQGRLVAKRVADSFEVSGVDRAPWEGHPDYMTVHTMDLRKKKFEDIFRRERPAAVVHLAFVRHFRRIRWYATRSTSPAPSACSSAAPPTA